jgi:ureidoacrylate peracid hydrolase
MTREVPALDPRTTALIVVDVQNDFCHPDGVCGRAGYEVQATWDAVAGVERLLKAAREAGSLVVHIRLNVDWDNDSRVWLDQLLRLKQPRLCEPGSFGAAAYRGAEELPGEPVIAKRRYSGFVGTGLEDLLRERGIRTIVVCGVATNICVESTARDGFMRDFELITVSDASGAYSRAAHDATLQVLDLAFGAVATAEEVARAWSQNRVSQSV